MFMPLGMLVLCMSTPMITQAQPLYGPEVRLQATDADNSDWFGRSVSLDGPFAVVGAPGDDEAATNAGAAYVFVYNGGQWTALQKLTAGIEADDFDEFGYDVSVERDLLAVGARWDDDLGTDSGAVYLYRFNGAIFELETKLLPNDPNNAAHSFGTAVDIGIATPQFGSVEVTNIAIGAPLADNFQGAVFLVEQSGPFWNIIGRFSDSDDTGINDKGHFGSSVEINGDHLVAGAPFDDQLGNNAGAAYVFGRANINNIWNEVTALYPNPAFGGDRFGTGVAIDTDVVAVGAPAAGSRPGRLFVYGLNNQTFTAGDNGEEYGYAVAIDGLTNTILVGAKRQQFMGPGGANAGAVYQLVLDDLGSWQTAGHFIASDAAINKEFGEAVAIRNGVALVGGSEASAFSPGAAYVYTSTIFRNGFDGL